MPRKTVGSRGSAAGSKRASISAALDAPSSPSVAAIQRTAAAGSTSRSVTEPWR